MHKHLAERAISAALTALTCTAAGKGAMAAPVTSKRVEVLICAGATAKSYEACLQACNNRNLIPGFEFCWKVVEHLTANDLPGKHVVMFPGGAVPRPGQVDIPALQAFVRAGGGYYGTCAGAIAAIREFQLTPQVKGKAAEFQGCVDVRMTDWGTRVFGYGGNVILRCFNGMAFFDPADVSAPCAFWGLNHRGDRARLGLRSWPARGDNPAYTEKRPWQVEFDHAKSGEKYMQSYVDRLGKGRVVVVNAHPEIGKDRGYWFPRWVGAGVVWAAGHENALDSYRLGFDQGLYDESRERFTAASETALVCQREYVSESGTISAIWALTGGAGDAIVGVYDGETRPERCLAQSAPTALQSAAGWQSISLAAPLTVKKGQTIWLCLLLASKERQYFHQRFPDENGDTYEDRAWASTCDWSALRGGRLPGKPAGEVRDYLVCLFADVRFQESDGRRR